MVKIGYHYTPFKNLSGIEKKGLIPKLITHKHLIPIIRKNSKGIYLFKRELRKEEVLGSLIYHFLHRGTYDLIELKVKYDNSKLLTGINGETLICKHFYSDCYTNLHKKIPFIVYKVKIYPENIEKTKRNWSLKKVLDYTDV